MSECGSRIPVIEGFAFLFPVLSAEASPKMGKTKATPEIQVWQFSAASAAYSRLEQQLGNEHLLTALRPLQMRERYILLARVLENRPFDALAAELGLSYKGVPAIYYRTLKKIKQTVEEESNEL